MSVKRYGYGPQTVKTKIGLLKIDYNGRAYRVEHGTMYRINSIWFPRTGILSVEDEGITVKLRPTRNGITILPNEEKEKAENEENPIDNAHNFIVSEHRTASGNDETDPRSTTRPGGDGSRNAGEYRDGKQTIPRVGEIERREIDFPNQG